MAKRVKDPRYEVVQMMLLKKRITNFQGIFKYIPPSIVAMDMRTNNKRMKGFIENPGGLKLIEIHKLADLFEYDFTKMLELIEGSYKPE